jgi:23S rRNA (adenine1618-N6)-methyltransferase
LKVNGQLDFSNPDSVKQLTKTLLKKDFGLKIELPDDRLCPPVCPSIPFPAVGLPEVDLLTSIFPFLKVPNRLNYLLWIQSLLDTSSMSYSDTYDSERQVLGLDIGTGASCIYPLLGCAQRPKWRFGATDIDQKSLQFAQRNVQLNGLQNRVKLHQSKPDGPLLPLDDLRFSQYGPCSV